MDLIIVGLGNPGNKYKDTIHNLGYLVIDNLLDKFEQEHLSFQKSKSSNFEAWTFNNFKDKDIKLILVKPATFMNLSGNAMIEIFYKLRFKEKKNLLIVHDDVDIDKKKVKCSINQSSAGHKGVEDIILKIGNGFWRVRIGCKSFIDNMPTIDMVLFNLKNSPLLSSLRDQVENGVKEVLTWIEKKASNL
ncbi:aminoacyl-tRNA hydrolase [Mycoplasma sp. SG1]|uniref:aminoacyl-tRNA hydrolase n=1 Tax=Mycoplasma sp. SG1 TaxID=2810348 RepID=UPI0020248811|nr:aminoacyl-tRNA hydrolase [Mycoplasma sp. SG1]URM52817.1 aminoacyl-tRNA hydrolase [Mycoplasma sp. SG1]